ncbi:MAG: arginine deiminase family protein [Planctomycetota bacterium]
MRALVHAVGDRLAQCELTFVGRTPIDVARARAQHAAYCRELRACGVEVRVLDVSPDQPDATFLEDAAVVLDEVAIAASMGTAARRAEVDNLVPVLAELRPVLRLAPPATLEGGDVLRLGKTMWVGLSPRTNLAGVEAFAGLVAPYGYRVLPVQVDGCLHLKTACTALDDETLLANRAWVQDLPLAGRRCVDVAEGEPFAANVLRAGVTLLASASHPRTLARIDAAGHDVRPIELDELEKAEAGATCLSILLR